MSNHPPFLAKYLQDRFNFKDLFLEVFCLQGSSNNVCTELWKPGFCWLSHTIVQSQDQHLALLRQEGSNVKVVIPISVN